ncbi:MAG TPA: hypothetical protein VK894_05210 [Jiangellales bacterium]|nr:hypothetical protein [Jiangellales bacterium]
MSRLVQLIRTAVHHPRHARRGDPSPEEIARRAAAARAVYFARVHDAG